ncbi:hypothetical protein FB45DRAFT_1122203 [Roridomyces roridus]|uniref:F-box domain-containing protein n=1 Tax=Roridomyces roridus TaxID=1738132 RepID=A0AAD7FBM1_9AGAR|nr:hypothetical protein FB45DRAFT_1122203 [Roridomyces roridus]
MAFKLDGCSRLPPELCALIVQNLDDTGDLRRCSLVCRAWLGPSRARLQFRAMGKTEGHDVSIVGTLTHLQYLTLMHAHNIDDLPVLPSLTHLSLVRANFCAPTSLLTVFSLGIHNSSQAAPTSPLLVLYSLRMSFNSFVEHAIAPLRPQRLRMEFQESVIPTGFGQYLQSLGPELLDLELIDDGHTLDQAAETLNFSSNINLARFVIGTAIVFNVDEELAKHAPLRRLEFLMVEVLSPCLAFAAPPAERYRSSLSDLAVLSRHDGLFV